MAFRKLCESVSLQIFIIIILVFQSATGSISCYQCSSKNHTEVYCEDPMAPAYLPISKNCMVPKENHEGNFPANYCVKMIGISVNTGEHLVIRTCVLEDMNSQCGTFRFEEDTLRGCILTCDYDGCNVGSKSKLSFFLSLIGLCLAFTLIHVSF